MTSKEAHFGELYNKLKSDIEELRSNSSNLVKLFANEEKTMLNKIVKRKNQVAKELKDIKKHRETSLSSNEMKKKSGIINMLKKK